MLNDNLSQRIKNLPSSQALEMAAKARELREKGLDIISLSLGEPDFNIPDFIKDSAVQAINDNYHSYPALNGYLELREAVCKKFKRDNGLDYTPDQIVISTGAKQSLANTALVLLDPGDEVLLLEPFWVSYELIVKMCDAIPIRISTGIVQNFKVTPEQLEAAITPKTKLLFLNSPSNPSGAIYSESEYRALAKVLEKYPNIYIISDEIYEHIRYSGDHFSFAKIPSMYERTITINGLSKGFAMTGWRLGYLGAPQWIAKACTKMQGQVTSGANCITQRAAITALEASPDKVQYMVEEFKNRRDLVYELLKDIPGFITRKPEGAFYFLPDISYYFGKTLKGRKINNATDFSMYLLEVAQVASVTGDAFGAPNCIRLSFATSTENLKEAIERIKKALI